jgi:hypothetical protein
VSTIADDRLLQQVRDLQGCLTTIKALAPKRAFNTKTGREGIALSAQGSQTAIPELISAGADGMLQLDYASLSVFLIGAVNELAARVEALEAAAAPAA